MKKSGAKNAVQNYKNEAKIGTDLSDIFVLLAKTHKQENVQK